jgi:hypothetical protein
MRLLCLKKVPVGLILRQTVTAFFQVSVALAGIAAVVL